MLKYSSYLYFVFLICSYHHALCRSQNIVSWFTQGFLQFFILLNYAITIKEEMNAPLMEKTSCISRIKLIMAFGMKPKLYQNKHITISESAFILSILMRSWVTIVNETINLYKCNSIGIVIFVAIILSLSCNRFRSYCPKYFKPHL